MAVPVRFSGMEIARALILAEAVEEHGPWPASPAGSKHLFPIANQPILFHNLEHLRQAGVLEATVLAGDATRREIERAAGGGRKWGLTLSYAEWTPASGVVGALSAARAFVDAEPIVVQQGDALLRDRLHGHIRTFAREGLDTLALRLDPGPRTGSHLPAPGYLMSSRAVSILLDGSRPQVNPVACVRSMGGLVREQRVEGCLPCHGDQENVLDSNRRLLETVAGSYDESSVEDCTIQGPVVIDPSALVRRSLLRGPAIIGPGARITDAYVGPYTSIGAGVVVEGAQIEYSIVLESAELRFVGIRLESSVIGRGARIVRGFQFPGAMRMAVGEGAEVVLS